MSRLGSFALTSVADRERLARDVLGQVAGRWSFAVVCVLAKAGAPVRFTRVLEAVDGVSQKVLTTNLRQLERDGFVERKVFAQVPPRVEYALTPLGSDLYDHAEPLFEWALNLVETFEASRRVFDSASGTV